MSAAIQKSVGGEQDSDQAETVLPEVGQDLIKATNGVTAFLPLF
jgi:hypothetical protein